MNHEQEGKRGCASILVVDDHPIVRQGLKQMLNMSDDLRLCCEAGNADEALAAMSRCHHDLAVVDISLEGKSGLQLISALSLQYSDCPVLVMSMHEESLYAERCLRLGAKGFITKQQATNNIHAAIRHILDGGIYLSSEFQANMLLRMKARGGGHPSCDPTAGLTNREFEVLRLIGFGFGIRQIAERLKRSVKTVETHRNNIKEKLGLKTSLELVRYAMIWVKEAD